MAQKADSVVYYTSGDESEQMYWQHATGMTYHGANTISTKWTLEQVLADLKDFTVTSLFVRKGKDAEKIITLIGLINGPDGQRAVLNLKHFGDRNNIFAHVSTESEAELTFFLERIFANIEEYEHTPVEPDGVFLHYTFCGEYGPDTITREISAPTWEETQGNYAENVQGKLAKIISTHPKDLAGKVGVIHGPPRTGKTFWLRSLARAWSKTAHITYIVDSAEFFRDSSYMMRVLLDTNHGKDVWHVLIFEDAEEFITAGAKSVVGPALSKLLNLGDGLLGQGLNILFLFTTNVTVDKLHDALTGPGRCFDVIEVPLLPQEHAARWLREHGSKVMISGDQSVGALYKILHGGEHEEPATYDITAPYL